MTVTMTRARRYTFYWAGLLLAASAAKAIATDARGVRNFYAETLPQLGWQRLSELTFRREGEVLRIVIEDRRQPIVVRFSLAPQGATP